MTVSLSDPEFCSNSYDIVTMCASYMYIILGVIFIYNIIVYVCMFGCLVCGQYCMSYDTLPYCSIYCQRVLCPYLRAMNNYSIVNIPSRALHIFNHVILDFSNIIGCTCIYTN